MTDVNLWRLQDAWQQCNRHLHHLSHALAALRPRLPMTAAALATLSDEVVQDWDQFVLRFTKLQDTMGGKLYPAVLAHFQEPYDDRPMLDKLNRLEKLGYLSSVSEWQRLRVIRNGFAHDYPDDDVLKAAVFNQTVEAVPVLVGLLGRIKPVVDAALGEATMTMLAGSAKNIE